MNTLQYSTHSVTPFFVHHMHTVYTANNTIFMQLVSKTQQARAEFGNWIHLILFIRMHSIRCEAVPGYTTLEACRRLISREVNLSHLSHHRRHIKSAATSVLHQKSEHKKIISHANEWEHNQALQLSKQTPFITSSIASQNPAAQRKQLRRTKFMPKAFQTTHRRIWCSNVPWSHS
jgi:hypothetical protein